MAKRAAKRNDWSDLLNNIRAGATVAVIGDRSRTWYEDSYVLCEILMALEESLAEAVIIGDRSFRCMAGQLVEGSAVRVLDTEDIDALCAVDTADAFVVLSSRVQADLKRVNPLLEAVFPRGVPVVAMHPQGDSTYVRGG